MLLNYSDIVDAMRRAGVDQELISEVELELGKIMDRNIDRMALEMDIEEKDLNDRLDSNSFTEEAKILDSTPKIR